MIQFHLIFVGKTSFPEIDTAIRRYLDRISHYAAIEVHLIKASKILPKSQEDAAITREAERIMKLLNESEYVIVWDSGGKDLDSVGLARFVERLRDEGIQKVWMVIGGPLGLSREILDHANTVLSLSRMTFPHDLARLMVVEQLYRAFTILKGEPYHK